MQDPTVTGFELSPVQERLYTVSQGGDAFQCQSALLIDGPLDVARMRTVIEQTVARYEISADEFSASRGSEAFGAGCPVFLRRNRRFETADFSGEEGATRKGVRIDQDLRDNSVSARSIWRTICLTRFRLLTLGRRTAIFSLFTLSSLCSGRADAYSPRRRNHFRSIREPAKRAEETLQYADFSAWQRDLVQSGEEDAQQGEGILAQRRSGRAALTGTALRARRTADAAFAPETIVAVPLARVACPPPRRIFFWGAWLSRLLPPDPSGRTASSGVW